MTGERRAALADHAAPAAGAVDGVAGYAAACGALGAYDLDRVAAIAAAAERPVHLVHEDDGSILLLDRRPLEWAHAGSRGLAWSEGLVRPEGVTSWRDAARRLAACGLVLEGRCASVHASVAGMQPLYYMKEEGATYFASRVDPLVRSARRGLSVDWETWATIFLVGSPLGAGTPFREVRRLEPYSLLTQARGRRARLRSEQWPWAEIKPGGEPGRDEAVAGALHSAVAALPRELPVACPLSGGWDSRLLLCALAEEPGRSLAAFTAERDNGIEEDVRFAPAVASSLGVPHETVPQGEAPFWDDMAEAAARTDYQCPHHGWAMPLVRRIEADGAIVVDGIAGDVLLQPGGRLVPRELMSAKDGPAAASHFWERISAERAVSRVLGGRVAHALAILARRQFFAAAEAVARSPSRGLLTIYWNRAAHYNAFGPACVIGQHLPVVTPFTDDGFARAVLAVSPEEKFEHRLYDRVFGRLNGSVGGLPSTNDSRDKPKPFLPQRELAEPNLHRYERALLDGAFAPYLAARARSAISTGETRRLLRGPGRRGVVRSIAAFGLWHDRYSHLLGGLDLAEVVA